MHVKPTVQSESAQSIAPSMSLSIPSKQFSTGRFPLLEVELLEVEPLEVEPLELELVCPVEPPVPPCPLELDVDGLPPCPELLVAPPSPLEEPVMVWPPVFEFDEDWNTPSVSVPQAGSMSATRVTEQPEMTRDSNEKRVRCFMGTTPGKWPSSAIRNEGRINISKFQAE